MWLEGTTFGRWHVRLWKMWWSLLVGIRKSQMRDLVLMERRDSSSGRLVAKSLKSTSKRRSEECFETRNRMHVFCTKRVRPRLGILHPAYLQRDFCERAAIVFTLHGGHHPKSTALLTVSLFNNKKEERLSKCTLMTDLLRRHAKRLLSWTPAQYSLLSCSQAKQTAVSKSHRCLPGLACDLSFLVIFAWKRPLTKEDM